MDNSQIFTVCGLYYFHLHWSLSATLFISQAQSRIFLYLFCIGLAFYYPQKPIFCKLKEFTVCCFILVIYEILIPMDPVVCTLLWRSHCFSPHYYLFTTQYFVYDKNNHIYISDVHFYWCGHSILQSSFEHPTNADYWGTHWVYRDK